MEALTAAILDLVELYCNTFNADFQTAALGAASTPWFRGHISPAAGLHGLRHPPHPDRLGYQVNAGSWPGPRERAAVTSDAFLSAWDSTGPKFGICGTVVPHAPTQRDTEGVHAAGEGAACSRGWYSCLRSALATVEASLPLPPKAVRGDTLAAARWPLPGFP